MNDVASLLQLPTDTIVVLAAGFLGYRIASVGLDRGHGSADVIFGSLVFAVVARITAMAVATAGGSVWAATASSIVITCLAAMLWRRWGSTWAYRLLRAAGVSTSDRHQTAWDPLRVNPALRPSQIIVRRKDGTQLMCDRLDRFAALPTRSCLFGADGSVALYVTDARGAEDEDWVSQDVEGPDDWGNLMTYVPASEVAQLMVRY